MAGELVGEIVDEVAFTVEHGKIREFARATFTEDPVHTDAQAAAAAGFDDVLATPTHVVVAGHQRDQRAVLTQLGLRLERVVVGSVTWQYSRPLRAGDSLHGSRRVVADEQREGKRGGSMRMITLETEFVDSEGSPAVRQKEVLIERGSDT